MEFKSATSLMQHIAMLVHDGYLIPEWKEKVDIEGNMTGAYRVYKINTKAIKKND